MLRGVGMSKVMNITDKYSDKFSDVFEVLHPVQIFQDITGAYGDIFWKELDRTSPKVNQ